MSGARRVAMKRACLLVQMASTLAVMRRASLPARSLRYSHRLCGSLFFLHQAQIADDGEQPLSDGRFGIAGKIEKRIKFVLVALHLR
jgi:hypothetical protein